jgi:hypothetical protein
MQVWSTQAKIEAVVHKSEWHRGNNSNVVNDQLGEPSHTPLSVHLPSACVSMESD